MQLCVVPAYALTVHKTQALSIKHLVIGLPHFSFKPHLHSWATVLVMRVLFHARRCFPSLVGVIEAASRAYSRWGRSMC